MRNFSNSGLVLFAMVVVLAGCGRSGDSTSVEPLGSWQVALTVEGMT